MSVSDQELGDLFTDPDAPTARLLGGSGSATIRVQDAVDLVKERHPDATDVESQIDGFISRSGGKKQRTLHLNDIGSHLIGRLAGRPRSAGVIVYEIPARLFEERGRAPTKLQMPPQTK